MSQRPPPVLIDFAARLLQFEIGRAGDGGTLSDGFQRVCRALYRRLAPLISPIGFSTVFLRAQRLAARDCPRAAVIAISVEQDCAASEPPASTSGLNSKEDADALALVLAHFIWLLVTFIGGNLGLGAVCELWPEVPLDTDWDF